jgi:hypothetical protein
MLADADRLVASGDAASVKSRAFNSETASRRAALSPLGYAAARLAGSGGAI